MREQLSRPPYWKYIFLIISGMLFLSLTINLFQNTSSIVEITKGTLSHVIFCLFFTIPYFLANRYAKGLYFEFDKKFLYRVTRTNEEKIDLRKIYAIERPTLQFGTNTTNRIIRYRNEEGLENKVRLNVNHRRKNFDNFMKLVQSANKKVDIKGFW